MSGPAKLITRWARTVSSSSNTPPPDPELLRTLFERLGFPVTARHRSKNVTLHRQGDINFIINAEADSFGQRFAREHGPSACAMAFRVKDAAYAYRRASSSARSRSRRAWARWS